MLHADELCTAGKTCARSSLALQLLLSLESGTM